MEDRKKVANAKTIQAVMRGKVARRDVKNLKSAIVLQKQGRKFVEKKR